MRPESQTHVPALLRKNRVQTRINFRLSHYNFHIFRMVQTPPGTDPAQEDSRFSQIPQHIYVQPSTVDSNNYYDIKQIFNIEHNNITATIYDPQNNDLFQLQTPYFFRYMEMFRELEFEIKAILLGKAIMNVDLPTYFRKRLLVVSDAVLKILFMDQNNLKIQVYVNEVLLLIQNLAFRLMPTHPALALQYLHKILNSTEPKFFDSRFHEPQFYPVINNFYAERLVHNVSSCLQGRLRPGANPEDRYNAYEYYPLEGEVLIQSRLTQNAFYLSPLIRIQIQHFKNLGGFELIRDSILNFSFQHIEALDVLDFLHLWIDEKLYREYFDPVKDKLINIHLKLTEDDIKNASRDTIRQLSEALERVIPRYYNNQEMKKYVGLTEMNIFMQCLICTNLEKRIFGLQQICDKINTSQDNDYMSREYPNRAEEWYMPENVLSFLVKQDTLSILFGDKAHFELIKRSFPLIKFFYNHGHLKQQKLLQILRMARDKHETWGVMVYKLLNDLAEILTETDMDLVLQEIKAYKTDTHLLNFVKSLSKNQLFDKSHNPKILDEQEENVNGMNASNLIIRVFPVQPMAGEDKDGDVQQFVTPAQTGKRSSERRSDDQDGDTSCEEGEGIRGRIVEFLLQVVHAQPTTEVGKHSFSNACSLICGQFRSLRLKYLTYAFSHLFENNPPLPISNYIALIQKIIQSSYPLENFKSQSDLIKYLDTTYNFKLSLLAVLCKCKKRYLEADHAQYLEIMEHTLKFYQFLHSASESKIQPQNIKLIWQLSVYNALNVQEQDTFFNWLHAMPKNLLEQEALQILLFDYFIKVDYSSYTLNMFNCLSNLILYFNVQYRILRPDLDSYMVLKPEILCFEMFWRLYFESHNPVVQSKAQAFLMQILKFRSASPQVTAQLKNAFVERLFVNPNVRALDFLIKMLEEIEGLSAGRNEKGERLVITVQNDTKNSMQPKRLEVTLYQNMTVYQAKQLIGPKLNPSMRADEFEIICRGIWLANEKQLKDLKFDQKNTFRITATNKVSDEQIAQTSMQPIPLPMGGTGDWKKLNDAESIEAGCGSPPDILVGPPNFHEVKQGCSRPIYAGDECASPSRPATEEIEKKVSSISEVVSESNRDFLRFCLEQKLWNDEQVIDDLLEKRDQLWAEFQQKQNSKQGVIQPQIVQPNKKQNSMYQAAHGQNQQVDECSMATITSRNTLYIQKLFDFFNYNDQTINNKVWQILSLIPRNKEIYETIDRALQDAQWDMVFDLGNHHKLFYNLQILKELLECDLIEDLDDYQSRKEVRENFLLHGGLDQILQLVMIDGIQSNIVQLALQIFSIYFHAYALSQIVQQDSYSRFINIMETIQKDEAQGYQVQKPHTPKFQSANPTPPRTPRLDENSQPTSKSTTQDEFKALILSFKNNQHLRDCMSKTDLDYFSSVLLQRIEMNLEQVFSLLLCVVFLKPQFAQKILQNQELQQYFLKTLTQNPTDQLRKIAQFTMVNLCELCSENEGEFEFDEANGVIPKQKSKYSFAAALLLRAYIPAIKAIKTEFDDLFVLLSYLLRRVESIQDIVNPKEFFFEITSFIINREILEERFQENEDKTLQGYLLLLTTLLEIAPENKASMTPIIERLYDFLFNLHEDYQVYPKFKRRNTRQRALQCLAEGCRDYKTNVELLIDPLFANHEKFDPSDLELDTSVKGTHGFVGLRNLGSTCYINSLLQQFFMNKPLRQGILNSEILLDGTLYKNVEEVGPARKKLQDHTLHQLQLVFIQLQESVKSYINPHPFIKTLMGFDGQPINVIVQHDVNEFFNLITDKLEKDQKGTRQEKLIPSIIGGVLCNQMKSLDPEVEYSNETYEPFLTVTVEIKGKRNLEEALDLYIKGDILDGEDKYFCEEINRKIDAQKRCFFKNLPNTLIITLKRFEFDFTTMLRVKVNDYFEFPLDFNAFKWTRDHLIEDLQDYDPTQYAYQLSGVLVHQGTAESGHYYSYIRTGEDKWFEFNDRNIYPFKLESLKEQCFGGEQGIYEWSNSKSAYLLFYDKIIKTPVATDGTNEAVMQSQVIYENSQFLKNQLLYSQEYLQFVHQFVQLYDLAQPYVHDPIISQPAYMQQVQGVENTILSYLAKPATKLVRFYTLFLYETLMKNKDTHAFVSHMQNLHNMYQQVVPASFWLLDYLPINKQLLNDLLFESSLPEVRQCFVRLLTLALQQTMAQESDYLTNETQISSTYPPYDSIFDSLFTRFMRFYLTDVLQTAEKNARRSSDYFSVLKNLMHNKRFVLWFQEMRYSKVLLTLLTKLFDTSYYSMSLSRVNDKNLEGPCSALTELLCRYIMGQLTEQMINQKEAPNTYTFKEAVFEAAPRHMESYIKDQILSSNQFKRIFVPLSQLCPQVQLMAQHLSWNDLRSSQQIMNQLMELLLEYSQTYQYVDSIFQIIDSLLRMKDLFQAERMKFFMFDKVKAVGIEPKGETILVAIERQFFNDRNFSFALIYWMAEITQGNPFVEEYFKERKDQLKFMLTLANRVHEYHIQLQYPTQKMLKAIQTLSIIFEEQMAVPAADFHEEQHTQPLMDGEFVNDPVIGTLIKNNREEYEHKESSENQSLENNNGDRDGDVEDCDEVDAEPTYIDN